MNILIVDDEQHCCQNLTFLLEKYCFGISTIKTANSVREAKSLFVNYKPDILFLDIQMPQQDGFHLLNEIDTENLSIVFVTAHDEYAIKAIKCGPTAYLLKPLDIEELKDAFEIATQQLQKKLQSNRLYKEALTALTSALETKKESTKICLSHASKLEIVHLNEVVALSSDNYYTTFFLACGRKIVMSKTLKTYENLLGEKFIRVHRSHIINIDHAQAFTFEDNTISLSNGLVIPVSRRKAQEVINQLKWIS